MGIPFNSNGQPSCWALFLKFFFSTTFETPLPSFHLQISLSQSTKRKSLVNLVRRIYRNDTHSSSLEKHNGSDSPFLEEGSLNSLDGDQCLCGLFRPNTLLLTFFAISNSHPGAHHFLHLRDISLRYKCVRILQSRVSQLRITRLYGMGIDGWSHCRMCGPTFGLLLVGSCSRRELCACGLNAFGSNSLSGQMGTVDGRRLVVLRSFKSIGDVQSHWVLFEIERREDDVSFSSMDLERLAHLSHYAPHHPQSKTHCSKPMILYSWRVSSERRGSSTALIRNKPSPQLGCPHMQKFVPHRELYILEQLHFTSLARTT